RRPRGRTSPAQAPSSGCFPPPGLLTPLRAAATAARGRAAPRAGSTHGRSAPRPWLVSGAATTWPNRCHGWVRTAATAGVRRRVATEVIVHLIQHQLLPYARLVFAQGHD